MFSRHSISFYSWPARFWNAVTFAAAAAAVTQSLGKRSHHPFYAPIHWPHLFLLENLKGLQGRSKLTPAALPSPAELVFPATAARFPCFGGLGDPRRPLQSAAMGQKPQLREAGREIGLLEWFRGPEE